MQNFKNEINKEFYKMQIERIGKNIIERADDILNDWDKGILTIQINTKIAPDEISTISVEKTYIPWEVK